jgi:hypothetical protein
MASTALKKITTRAKQIYKKGGTWKTAIKKAGAEYRGSHKKKSAPKKRRKVSGTLSAGSRPASYAVGKVRRRKKVGSLSDSPRPAGFAVGRLHIPAGTPSTQIRAAISGYSEKIAETLVRQMKAKTKREKKRLQTIINRHKKSLRTLQNIKNN